MVWVGAAQFDLRRRDPQPIAVYDSASLAWRCPVDALNKQGRRFKVVYSSSSLAGQIAAVESGIAVAVLTRFTLPEHLQNLGPEHDLGPLGPWMLLSTEAKRRKGPRQLIVCGTF